MKSGPRRCAAPLPSASVEEIDDINILQATMLAMRRAVEGLRLKPAKVLVDGNRLPVLDVLAEAIVKGDAKVPAISAASILAKVTRDRWCAELDTKYPQYGFAGHKGYGTAEHLAALQAHGACPEHRKTFAPVTDVLRGVNDERTHVHHVPRQRGAQGTAQAQHRQHGTTAKLGVSGLRATTLCSAALAAWRQTCHAGAFRVILGSGARGICASSYQKT